MKKEKSKIGPEVIEHWYSLVSDQQFSPQEFYAHIEEEIQAQKVPGLEVSRVDLSEGGFLSDKREYLRFSRERLFFDICAAPVGVNYFFSYRFCVPPAIVKPWEMVVFLVVTGGISEVYQRIFGAVLGPLLFVATFVFLAWFARNAIGMGLRDIDAALLRLPVIGAIYDRYLRKDTYYRQDMRIAYGSIVSAIVKQRVAEMVAEKGVQLVREYSYSPIFEELYEAKDVRRAAEAEVPA